jgi:hemerythrin superfamily protein
MLGITFEGEVMQKQDKPLVEKIESKIGQVKGLFERKEDIISVIKEDHKPLKELIQIMKDDDKPVAERKRAFLQFAPLLLTHAKAEEKSLYEFMKTNPDLREFGFEGDTEHGLADQLTEETKRAVDEDQLGAKIKVLAELVEHHIEEEENEVFPEVKSVVSEEILVKMTDKYVAVQAEIISEGQDDSPHESELNSEMPH